MKKTFCDACGSESSIKPMGIPCHLYSLRGQCGYVDQDMNRVSGRDDSIDLCSDCSNRVYSAAVEKLLDIQSRHNAEAQLLAEARQRFGRSTAANC